MLDGTKTLEKKVLDSARDLERLIALREKEGGDTSVNFGTPCFDQFITSVRRLNKKYLANASRAYGLKVQKGGEVK